MKAEDVLHQGKRLLESISNLSDEEREIVDEYIGEWINIDVATERLLKLKDKQNHE